MNLVQIEYFISVARHLNFTAAARSLFVTQPSLSKQIALLEKEIGVSLFYRNRRTVRLTPAGALLFREFGNINKHIDRTLEKVRRVGKGTEGKISIGCLETVNVGMFFPELIRKFSSAYPGINISIERGGFRYLRENLQDGGFDLVFTLSSDIENYHNLSVINVHKRKGYIVISRNNALAAKKDISFPDLSREPFVIVSHSESPGAFAKAIETAKTHSFNNIKEVNNVETLLSYLDLGLGFTVLDRSIGDHRKNNFRFIDLLKDEAVFYAVCAGRKDNLNPAVPLFFNVIS